MWYVERRGYCVAAGAAAAVGTSGCIAGSTGSAARWWALAVLASMPWQPVDRGVVLVEQPAVSVPVAAEAGPCYQAQGTGQAVGVG